MAERYVRSHLPFGEDGDEFCAVCGQKIDPDGCHNTYEARIRELEEERDGLANHLGEAMSRQPCAACGNNPALGWAFIGPDRYCHPDEGHSCYADPTYEGDRDG